MAIVSKYPLVSFTLLTFIISWGLWLPQALYSQGLAENGLSLWGFGSFGPSLAGLLVIALKEKRSGLIGLMRRLLDWKHAARWYLFIIFFPPTAIAFALLASSVSGIPFAFNSLSQNLPMLIPTFFLILFLGGPLNEELGWRGYMLPALLKKMDPLRATFILGIVWAVWHLPLFWIEGASQEGIPVLWVLLQILALAFIFTWMHNRTRGSLLMPLLLHSSLNTSGAFLPILPAQAGSLLPYLYTVILTVLFASFLTIITQKKL